MSTATLPQGWSLLDEPPAGLPEGWALAEPESKPLTASRVAELAGDVAAEAGGATAGQMLGLAGGPFAPVTVPLGGFIGGGIGNTIAQGRRMARGEPPPPPGGAVPLICEHKRGAGHWHHQ